MKKQLKLSCILVLSLVSMSACSSVNSGENNLLTSQKIYQAKHDTSVRGIVQFPSTFKTKATLVDVAASATVSIIYPSDYSNQALRNVVIASGLTTANGSFSINPSAAFAPASGDIFILEAVKRIGGAGNDAIALRTIIKWNATSFDSITTPAIYINTKTTALAIIASLSPSNVSSGATIGTMTTVNGLSVPSSIPNTPVTAGLINTVNDLVVQQITANIDPVTSIKVFNGVYTTNSATYTAGCVGEPGNCQ